MEQSEQKQFQCVGDCLKCTSAQRGYCASQHTYNNMKILEQMFGMVLTMQGEIKDLSGKIEAIQGNEESIFDPNRQEEIAQEASGAREKTAEIINNL